MKEKNCMVQLVKIDFLQLPLRNASSLVLAYLKAMKKKMPSRWQKEITRLKAYPYFHHLR